MKRVLSFLLATLLAAAVLGCHNDAEKGTLKYKDRPVPPDKQADKQQDKADKK